MKHEATTATHRSKAARGSDIAAATMLLRALRLRRIFLKANFDPNQPRKPRGTREGGQWTRPGGPAEPPADLPAPARSARNLPDLPDIPPGRPSTERERLALAKRIAVSLAKAGLSAIPLVRAVRVAWWLYQYYPLIQAYLDNPKTLDELQAAALTPKRGYDVHHIVEKTPASQDGFPASLIDSPQNRVRISTLRHWQITAWYTRKNEKFGFISPRDYLRGKSWEERTAIGKMALKEYGAMK